VVASSENLQSEIDTLSQQFLWVNEIPVLADIYSNRRVETRDGIFLQLKPGFTGIPAGGFLYFMIKHLQPLKTLEVGFGGGISSTFICQAHHDLGRTQKSHLALDPHQSSLWAGAGVRSVERAGLLHLMSHHEMSDFVALPMLHQMRETFQVVYIGGTHRMDTMFVNAFYVDLLLDVGGILVFEHNNQGDGNNSVMSFFATNRAYRHATKNDLGDDLTNLRDFIGFNVLIKLEHHDPDKQEPPNRAAVFDKIYTDNFWLGGGSGDGSNPKMLTEYYALIRDFVETKAIKSIVDIGCGDLQSLAFWQVFHPKSPLQKMSHISSKIPHFGRGST
jgi:hypothetical protein